MTVMLNPRSPVMVCAEARDDKKRTPTNINRLTLNAGFLIAPISFKSDSANLFLMDPDDFELLLYGARTKPKEDDDNNNAGRFLPWENKERQGGGLSAAVRYIDT